ncbi:hypothetical protein Tco_0652878 [Tanacetum coccineum]|uniref:Reverse transcriptase domain-containing protein n=1 Tax=Tanacetum coccineum TaxID=301880 RepID=A0ABQ4WYU0_9ASTR
MTPHNGDEANSDTIPETKSDEFIKSSVENLFPNPSEPKDFFDIEGECDVLVCDNLTNYSNHTMKLMDDDAQVMRRNPKISSNHNPLFDLDELVQLMMSFKSFFIDYPHSEIPTIDVVEDIPVDVPNILPTHPSLHMDFDFISSNDLGSDLDVSSPSGDSNKIYDPGICIEVESTRFLSTSFTED